LLFSVSSTHHKKRQKPRYQREEKDAPPTEVMNQKTAENRSEGKTGVGGRDVYSQDLPAVFWRKCEASRAMLVEKIIAPPIP